MKVYEVECRSVITVSEQDIEKLHYMPQRFLKIIRISFM